MHVHLAGFNVDTQLVDLIRQIIDEHSHGTPGSKRITELLQKLAEEPITPETLSAAYARISRSSKGIRELRRDARASVNRARRSNETIVFELGHSSIAEHAVFNLDITGASRLVLEALEAHRLASYTEASQRYIPMSGDFFVPDEILKTGLEWEFSEVCQAQFKCYADLIEILTKFHSEIPESERDVKAREDARYVLPLACRGQVGVTINARTAEQMVRSFNQSHLSEVRLMGSQIHEEVRSIVPSLIRYVEADSGIDLADREMARSAYDLIPVIEINSTAEVELISSPTDGESIALASILFQSGKYSFSQAKRAVDKLSHIETQQLIANSHTYLHSFDSVRRDLELGSFTFSITLSASAFAQLKRHRIASLITQDYDVELGCTEPPNIKDANGSVLFNEAMNRATEMYKKLIEKLKPKETAAASYVLTNAHRRRVIFQANARELTHFSRLREDEYAQWDIRNIAHKMIELARDACPGLMQFACGKDQFAERKQQLFS
ncbi:MAG: FAD-dependent thymidylate synthase [Calditrichaeota bacterium]|jgi:flavin-dependent thymidylate synthase|nr:FAD-dependent thymidylate synthase [Calditrichota bacterium]